MLHNGDLTWTQLTCFDVNSSSFNSFFKINMCLDKHLQCADLLFFSCFFFISDWREDWKTLNFTCHDCSQKHDTSSLLACKATYPQFKDVRLGQCTGGCPIIIDWVQFYRPVKANSITLRKIHTIVQMTMMMCSAAYICADKRWWLRLRLHDSTQPRTFIWWLWLGLFVQYLTKNSATAPTLMAQVKELMWSNFPSSDKMPWLPIHQPPQLIHPQMEKIVSPKCCCT